MFFPITGDVDKNLSMDIGYINFSQEERNNIYKVIQAIRDHQAIDELGIGRVRDAFSNEMFPGMSTLQNRAKYFVLLPALYLSAEHEKYRNVNEVRQKILELEIKLTRQLLNGTPDPADRKGITGSTVIDQAEKSSSRYVKYDPSYIYWGGLVTYKMVRSDGNIYQLIYERSQKIQERPARWRSNNSDDFEIQDDDCGAGDFQLCDAGGIKYIFDGKTAIPIQLTKEEAAFIKRQIITSEYSKDSLLAYILRHEDLPILPKWLDLGEIWHNIPHHFLTAYTLSAWFSKFIYLLRIFYNFIYDKKMGNIDKADETLQYFTEYRKKNASMFTKQKIDEVIAYVDSRVDDYSVKSFCMNTAALVEDNDLEKLEDCIIKRERETKGAVRAKLTNWKKYLGQEHVNAGILDFRWSLVYSMINEIRKGERNG